MDIAQWSINNKTIMMVLIVIILVGGIFSYGKLGRLEDPEFTIKDALIITAYPGASAQQVEQEVTEPLETAIQELGQLDEISSISKYGQSLITVTIDDSFDKKSMPQVWDELRRKVNDARSGLPPGVQDPIVYDDYGDVFGVLFSISGDGFSYKELQDYADFLKRELLLVPDVAKITLWGAQPERIVIEISRTTIANLGISLDEIYAILQQQNLIKPAGAIRVQDEYVYIQPSGKIDSIEDIGGLLISSRNSDKIIYLNDVAEIKREYLQPPNNLLRVDGKPAIALGISTAQGGNVVTMGDAVRDRLIELQQQLPLGVEIERIFVQSEAVSAAVNSFIINLLEALAIVIVILMLFMGLRSGAIIGLVLLLTVCATFIVMGVFEINLQRISLGALIIALGMLVDNAIVVIDGMLVRTQKGMKSLQAATEVVSQSMWPLFGATVIAILAFAAIGLSQDSTGEYTRSLFQVMLISLTMSWLIAITITPLLGHLLLPISEVKKEATDPYKGMVYTAYIAFLSFCIKRRWLTVSTLVGLLIAAIYGFQHLEDSFFPESTNTQFYVHYWLPEGTDIRKTSADLKNIENYLAQEQKIKSIATFVGEGAPRYTLVYSPEKSNYSYGLLLISVYDYRDIDSLIANIRRHIDQNYPDANPKFEKIRLGPGGGYSLEARFIGPDPNVLRNLSAQAEAIMQQAGATGVRNDWRNRVKVIEPQFAQDRARRMGVNQSDYAESLETTTTGTIIGIFREDDKLIPIISRPPAHERDTVDQIENIQLWSEPHGKAIHIAQLSNDFELGWEDAIINRQNKKRTITAQSDPLTGNASVILEKIKDKVEAIELPEGYAFEWGGEYENSTEAQKALSANIPITLLLMVFVVIVLFNALRQPLIIWLTVPLAVIGVTVGLLVTGESFGFMALLGFLSLSGMLIKNSIVLVDAIDLEIAEGKPAYSAIMDASLGRLRPVSMAALTTILGMMPLLTDVFFKGMAVTIMAGLAFATVITLIFVPVLYAILFRVSYKNKEI